MAKLQAQQWAEFSAPDLFDVEHVEVKSGLVLPSRLPRSRLFVWKDPDKRRDLVIFLGEAQPPMGKFRFCGALLDHVRELGVERVMTFAAMATNSAPKGTPRVFAAATDQALLKELQAHDLEILEDGHIGGLNGILLGAAATAGIPSACLLGEMPHLLAQLPYPAASLAILQQFQGLSGIAIDLEELTEEAKVVGEHLLGLWNRAQQALQPESEPEEEEEEFQATPAEEPRISEADGKRIEELFRQAAEDRTRAYELKRELDRLNLFAEYEDRFLDLFKPKNKGQE
jgi:proteasome assembly chaperone (PAC2) family protein